MSHGPIAANDNNVLPFSIGVRKESPRGDETDAFRAAQSLEVLAITREASAIVERAPERKELTIGPVFEHLVSPNGTPLTSLTWPKYMAWRKTKCRPYDYTNGPAIATSPLAWDLVLNQSAKDRGLEEIDQAILELIGEVAEIGEIIAQNGPLCLYCNLREKLIDECGDVIFCACWAMDAWGLNPVYNLDSLELIDGDMAKEAEAFGSVVRNNTLQAVFGDTRFVGMLGMKLSLLMLEGQTNAGLLANAFKKLKYQRREQDVQKQVARIVAVLQGVNQLLVLANSDMSHAVRANMAKLDIRYPEGYKPGQGGGNRTGEGA